MRIKSDHVFQFKVTLKDIKPPIWRRIVVPCDYTFWDLHVAIQDAMGWQDRHLHEFSLPMPYWRRQCTIGLPDRDDPPDQDPVLPTWLIPIAQFFTLTNRRAVYTYDFGDWWEHQLVLEKITPRVKAEQYPQCIGGRRACPPEDCGGAPGYADLLSVVSDTTHEDHEAMQAWIGRDFAPERFDRQGVRFADPQERLAAILDFEPEPDTSEILDVPGPGPPGQGAATGSRADVIAFPGGQEAAQGLHWVKAVPNLAPAVLQMQEMAQRGFRGYPVAIVVLYGPDDVRATKMAVGVIFQDGGDAEILDRWLVQQGDVRENNPVTRKVLDLLREQGVRSVILSDRILGCPHEEGIDYPLGEKCPECPFWSHHDRWTGEPIQ